jgi:hypothetical protein
LVVSRILSGTSHPQPVALLFWKNSAHFRTGSLPAVAGQPDPSRGAARTYILVPAGCSPRVFKTAPSSSSRVPLTHHRPAGSSVFGVFHCRRQKLPVTSYRSEFFCASDCGPPADKKGHHRVSCPTTGVGRSHKETDREGGRHRVERDTDRTEDRRTWNAVFLKGGRLPQPSFNVQCSTSAIKGLGLVGAPRPLTARKMLWQPGFIEVGAGDER